MVSARFDMHRPSVCLISGYEKRLPSRLAGCIAMKGVHKGMRMKSSVSGKAAVTALAVAGSPSLRDVGPMPEQLSIELIQARSALRLAKDQGWPEKLSLSEAAYLQAMGKSVNPKDIASIAPEWVQLLGEAVERGVLLAEKVTQEFLIQEAGTDMVTIDSFSGRRRVEDVDVHYQRQRSGRAGIRQTGPMPVAVARPAKYGTRTRVLFRPGDLANFFHLHSDTMEPGRHLVAWIRAMGAQWPVESVSSVEMTIGQTEILEPFDWASLVTYRQKSTGAMWTDNMRRIALDEKRSRTGRLGAQGVVKAMAAELGVSVKVVNEQIAKLGQVPKREVKNLRLSGS